MISMTSQDLKQRTTHKNNVENVK